MRDKFVFISIIAVLTCCFPEKEKEAILFLSNVSLDHFDQSSFKVFINNELVFSDSVENQYVSSHWRESRISVPTKVFNLKVLVSGDGYEIERDTSVRFCDSLFIRFNFYPFYKRYRNPDIYRYLPKETTRFREIADSLYVNNMLSNSKEYLNDTIPLRKSIEISFK
jgi:hypothetical protein